MPEFMTVKEVADLFHVKIDTVYAWKFYGKIKAVRINGKLLFRKDVILEMIGG